MNEISSKNVEELLLEARANSEIMKEIECLYKMGNAPNASLVDIESLFWILRTCLSSAVKNKRLDTASGDGGGQEKP